MADKTIPVPATLLHRMVGFIEKAGELVEQLNADKQLAKQAAPETAELLVQKGLLSADQQQKAAAALGDSHAKTVEILRRTATHVGTEKAAAAPAMGAPAQENLDPVSDADRSFLEGLGF